MGLPAYKCERVGGRRTGGVSREEHSLKVAKVASGRTDRRRTGQRSIASLVNSALAG